MSQCHSQKQCFFVPNLSTMVHRELAFLVHIYGNFHLRVAVLLEKAQKLPLPNDYL